MASTTIADVKQALVDLLGDTPGEALQHGDTGALAGVQIAYGHPGELIEAETVIVGRARGQQSSRVLGNRKRDETYTVDVAVNVLVSDDQKAADDRCLALFAQIAAALAGDEDLGLADVFIAEPGELELVENVTDRGREAELRLSVDITARVQPG